MICFPKLILYDDEITVVVFCKNVGRKRTNGDFYSLNLQFQTQSIGQLSKISVSCKPRCEVLLLVLPNLTNFDFSHLT